MKLRLNMLHLGILPRGCRLSKRDFKTLQRARLILSGLAGSASKDKDREILKFADKANDELKKVTILCNPKGRGGL